MNSITEFDFKILDYIYENLHTDFLDRFVPVLTGLGGHKGFFWIAVAVILILIPKTRKAGVCALIAMLLGFIVTNLILKNAVCRIRPYDINTAIHLLVAPLTDYSFPSGHSCVSFAASTSIFIFNKKIGIFALILAALIAMSRLYLYVHYPTDVIVGSAIGILAGMAASKMINRREVQKSNSK